MMGLAGLQLTDDLRLTVSGGAVRLSPSDGFDLAETLARKSMRLAMAQEAVAASPEPTPVDVRKLIR